MLEYRVRRLPAARERRGALGRAGARFPWESAADGRDVTPASARLRHGRARPRSARAARGAHRRRRRLGGARATSTGRATQDSPPVRAASCSSRPRATGPRGSARPRRPRAHLRRHRPRRVPRAGRRQRVHERDGALEPPACRRLGRRRRGRRRTGWLAIADALVDGYDHASGIYEQFAGFFALEPLVIAEIAPRRPIAADLLLGAERTAGAQVLKQAGRAHAPPPRPRRGRAGLARAEPRLLRAANRARELALAGDPRRPARPRRPLPASTGGARGSQRGSTSTT